MSYAKLILLTYLLVSSFCFAQTSNSAAKKPIRKPTQVESSTFRFRVFYGEKTTIFNVSKSKNGGRVDFSNNLGARDTKEISVADYEYLKSKVSNFSGTNQKEFCMRNFIEVKTVARVTIGCLGAPNRLAEDIQETTNLIGILF